MNIWKQGGQRKKYSDGSSVIKKYSGGSSVMTHIIKSQKRFLHLTTHLISSHITQNYRDLSFVTSVARLLLQQQMGLHLFPSLYHI